MNVPDWSAVLLALEDARGYCVERGGGKVVVEVNVDPDGKPHVGPVTTTTKPRPWREQQ